MAPPRSDRDKSRSSSNSKPSSRTSATPTSRSGAAGSGSGAHHQSSSHHSSRSSPGPASPKMDPDRQRVHAAGPRAMAVSNLPLARRPGPGRVGTNIRLETNFFRMQVPRSLVVSQYTVKIYRLKGPEERRGGKRKSRSSSRQGGGSAASDADREWVDVAPSELIFWNRAVFDRVCARHSREMGCVLAYDGRSIAYAPREVNRKCLGVKYRVSCGREGQAPTNKEQSEGKAESVEVEIQHSKYLKFDDVISQRVGTIAAAEYLAALDVVISVSPLSRYVQVGRSFYSSTGAINLGRRNHTASAWRGFYQSARLSVSGLVVNLDESFTAFWNKGGRPLSELVREANDGRDLSTSDNRSLKEIATKLRALKVKAVHTGISYKVHGFSNRGADRIVFDSPKDGRKISIADYFHSTYNIRLRHPHQPCVKTNPKRDTYLPMEMLTVAENQRLTGMLSQDQTQTIVKIASSKPHLRREAAIKTMQRLNHTNDRVCKDFNVKVAPGLVPVDGRVLPVPMIQYRNAKMVKPSGGQWRKQKGELYATGGLLYSWAVINLSRLRPGDVAKFVADVVNCGRKCGVQIPNANPKLFTADHRNIAQKLREVKTTFERDEKLRVNNYPLQLILIIKDRQDAPTYNLIKRVGDLELGVATQVCLQKHCEPGARRDVYCDNLMLKINTKIGGQNSVVNTYQSDRTSAMKDAPFMARPHIVLGADVTHPIAGGRSPSVAALVGSRDRQTVQFSGSIRNQPGRKEVITELGDMFKEVYMRWFNNFKKTIHAEAVIMFRDGVSDGQFQEVMEVEVAALRRACSEFSKNFRPKITYIIVTKRHHVRFFADRKHQDRSGNIPPGTVIDKDIVSQEYYDFFLNSHAGIQGTNKPSKYTVLVDENKISPDELQGYIYRLSHAFVRCNRSVSMVNSAYYAHLLAFRGRAYLGEDMDDMSTASNESQVPPAPRLHEFLSKRLYFV